MSGRHRSFPQPADDPAWEMLWHSPPSIHRGLSRVFEPTNPSAELIIRQCMAPSVLRAFFRSCWRALLFKQTFLDRNMLFTKRAWDWADTEWWWCSNYDIYASYNTFVLRFSGCSVNLKSPNVLFRSYIRLIVYPFSMWCSLTSNQNKVWFRLSRRGGIINMFRT